MRRSGLVPLLILLYPILEIVGFIWVGGWIGVLPTVLLILAGVFVGAGLVRASGLRLLTGLRADMAAGRRPEREIAAGAMTAIAGLLLILPGFISDIAGLLLLLPPLQTWVAGLFSSGVTVVRRGGAYARPAEDGVVDLNPDDFRRRSDPSSPWRDGDGPPTIEGR